MTMDEKKPVTTRRGALGRLLGIVAGAVGVGALTGSKAEAETTSPVQLTLYVPHLWQTKVGPAGSATYLPYGAVVDGRGREVGSLHTGQLDSTAGAVTMQTFQLAGGTIVGVGSNDTYVVVGSTGRYAGVAGAYVERPATRLPGREFTFTFREGSNGS
jgi:hypothetical protein